jgi:hypothetical protein
MRLKLMILGAFMGAFGLAGLALAIGSGGGGGAGHGGGGGGAGHAGTGHAGAQLGSRIPSISFGGREPSISLGTHGDSEFAKVGLVGVHGETIDGHKATVVVFRGHPLSRSEKDRIYRYHFKGFNECAGHGACPESGGGTEMYCRRARNVAITSDLECLSFRPIE